MNNASISSIEDAPFFCSWSGGKDSCLALYRTIKEGGKPQILFTMFAEGALRSRSHGLPLELYKEQSSSLEIPFIYKAASWQEYEEVFIKTLHTFKDMNINIGVFGDIDLEDHRKWEEKVCNEADIEAYLPLWKEERTALLLEFIDNGFKTMIIAIKEGVLDKKYLGRILDRELIAELDALDIDPCGEEGEFHTVVLDGPIFTYAIEVEIKQEIFNNGYWFIDIAVL
ncbi:Dph6-related ATP pyrophosphatase [Alkaliphilus peptidifermentans]|uniref:MJ0570-related uncharacterized domain-containing protein n=1 Tax=Alkaliphilus peptidifermentans DSM 18978 TaxID=1120976 RepID=A0A1G5KK83_9FIRM|nr:diphthine--ammonia ligase [Alkaliphilus peptidifermentans]SCZ00784.1 MJ0570-related uncharacterized domain-containing protein [Alkaliphilus peptidifermentans DSM 18978]